MKKLTSGIKILSIGNSFSEDATTYLHEMAALDGIELTAVNPFIGGCVLERHWNNIVSGEAVYDGEINGEETDERESLRELIEFGNWDIVTIQQGSRDSGRPETYFPFLQYISSFIKEKAPDAKQFLHETWAYEIDTDHDAFSLHYESSQQKMYDGITRAYGEASKVLSLPVIPCGEIIQLLRKSAPFDYENGGISLCRDGYHMHKLYGRFTLSAAWYECLLKKDVRKNGFIPTCDGESADEHIIEYIRQTVHDFINTP